jgi:poly-gamma-glutamate synthesis protein (capsule biosynthesis protein)
MKQHRAPSANAERFLLALVVLLAVAIAVVAFLAKNDEVEGASTPSTAVVGNSISMPSSAPILTTSTTVARDPFLGSGESITIAFGGDVHFEGVLRGKLASDPATVLAPIAPLLSQADLAMVNLETAITEGGTPVDKEYVFRTPATALEALKWSGVDVATMANNHGVDFGSVGLADSLAAEQSARFPLVGIGANASEAYAPWRTVIRGQRIAVFGASQVIDRKFLASWTASETNAGIASAYEPNLQLLLAAIEAERLSADTIVVYLHWGTEREVCPTGRQQTLAQQLSDAGADVIVGAHAHRLQGAGRLGDTFVAYGLGNFVFYAKPDAGADSGVLTVSITGQRLDGYSWAPARISGGVPQPLVGDSAVTATAAWNDLRSCTNLAP